MLANGVKETTTTTGTGTVTLAAVNGRVRFSQAFPVVGSLVNYSISNGDNWEWGIGTIGAGNTLARSVILGTLVAGAYTTVSASALTLSGSSDVFCADIAESRVSAIPASNSGYIATGCDGYLESYFGAAPSVSVTANRLYLIPFRLEYAVSVTGLLAALTVTAGTKLRIGIYSVLSTGLPGNLIAQTSDLSSTTTGNKTGAITQTRLAPGWFFLAIVCDGAPTFTGDSRINHAQNPLGSSTASFLYQNHYAYADISPWSVLPSTAPAVTLVTGAVAPRILMQVAA